MGLIKHYGMTTVNIHGIKPPQRRHDRKAIAQDQALVADAFLSDDAHHAASRRTRRGSSSISAQAMWPTVSRALAAIAIRS